MASFDVINYGLRPSKSIQRQIVFDGIRRLQMDLNLEKLVYVGFGSIWFTDFVMAHKLLHINDMVSIEANEIGYRRAVYNSPFATVRVMNGNSYEVLPTLYSDTLIKGRPWLIWLDYDYELNESVRDDLRSIIENAPANSIVLVTFNGSEMKYGAGPDRPLRLRELLGSVVPDDLSKNACREDRLLQTLANLTRDYMTSVAAELARPGGFVPAFRLVYKDSAPMVTVGGILPTKGAARIATDIVNDAKWTCMPAPAINAPHLTIREASALQALLPSVNKISRADVRKLGFDLDDDQIAAFETYYRQYPAFAQIIA
jgi:hypothetical protein